MMNFPSNGPTSGYSNIYTNPPAPKPCPTCGRCPTCGTYKAPCFTTQTTTGIGSATISNATSAKTPFTYT